MTAVEAKKLIATLGTDRSIWASAPCGHEFRLSESQLFYHTDLPPEGEEWLRQLREQLEETRKEIDLLKVKLTTGFTEKSVQVKLGKTVEKVIPMLPGFPYARHDCRALFDPIDYIAFVGLGERQISRVDFLDVKTGNARLTAVQAAIKNAVEDGKVSLREMGT